VEGGANDEKRGFGGFSFFQKEEKKKSENKNYKGLTVISR